MVIQELSTIWVKCVGDGKRHSPQNGYGMQPDIIPVTTEGGLPNI